MARPPAEEIFDPVLDQLENQVDESIMSVEPELALDEFVQQSQVNQLTPDEFANELKLQYGIDLTSMGKTFSQMDEVFEGAPEVPEGMRRKTLTEEIT